VRLLRPQLESLVFACSFSVSGFLCHGGLVEVVRGNAAPSREFLSV